MSPWRQEQRQQSAHSQPAGDPVLAALRGPNRSQRVGSADRRHQQRHKLPAPVAKDQKEEIEGH